METLETLKKSSLFKNWKEADLKAFASLCKFIQIGAGETLFLENDSPNSFFIIHTGTIRIRKSTTSGDDANVVDVGSGSQFGELGLLGVEKRTATAECIERSSLIEIPYNELEQFLKKTPEAGYIFFRNLSENLAGRIRKTTEDLTGLKSLRLRHL